jgi:peptide/nickel transport system substrate-binding protein
LDLGTASAATPGPAIPTPPQAPSLLVVCLGEEPSSLYLYQADSPEARTILEAIYDGPFDVVGYQYQPALLESTPTLGNGQARLEAVTVSQEALYFNPDTRLPGTLSSGKMYAPSGCTGPDCLQLYQGGDVAMDRLVVEFQLRADVTWADGEPVTAEDSVFSFQLNADPQTPGSKDLVYRTASYEAVDGSRVRWTGIPGYLDPEIAAHFWTPLPEHLLAEIPAADLPTSDAGGVNPMGWGPYQIESRVPGQSISLVRNPNYFRSGDGLPHFDEVLFLFVGAGPATVVQQVLTGECDIADESALGEEAWPLLLMQEAQGSLQLATVPGPRLMRADFLQPGAPLFSKVETRLALAQCVDREGWLRERLGALGAVPTSYVPPNHPLAESGLPSAAYDPAAAATALEAAGWTDDDGSSATPRVAHGVEGLANGTPLAWRLGVAPGGLEEDWARKLVLDFARCGATVSLELVPAVDLYAPYPDGPVFGGRLGMVVWSWLGWVTPACELFASWEIPSAGSPEGSNASGFSDSTYDAACRTLLFGAALEGPGAEAARVTQRVFAEQVPALPLTVLPRVAAFGPGVCGLQADASSVSLLWDLEALAPCVP